MAPLRSQDERSQSIIYANASDYDNGIAPRLGVPRRGKEALLRAMTSEEPIAIAAGYLVDYSTGKPTDIVDMLYEKGDVRWSREETWNLEHNDMEVSDEFVDALLERSRRDSDA